MIYTGQLILRNQYIFLASRDRYVQGATNVIALASVSACDVCPKTLTFAMIP